MPIEYPEPGAPSVECDSCAQRSSMVEADDIDNPNGYQFTLTEVVESFTWRVPLGWVQMPVAQPVNNPLYPTAKEEGRTALKAEYEVAKAALDQQRENFTEEQIASVEADLAELLADIEAYEPEDPPIIVRQLEGVLCPKCVPYLQTRLNFDDWEAEE